MKTNLSPEEITRVEEFGKQFEMFLNHFDSKHESLEYLASLIVHSHNCNHPPMTDLALIWIQTMASKNKNIHIHIDARNGFAFRVAKNIYKTNEEAFNYRSSMCLDREVDEVKLKGGNIDDL